MSYLQKYINKYSRPFGLGVIFLTIESMCDLMQPTIMSKIIDSGVATKNLEYVFKLGGVMLLVTALGAAAATIRSIFASRVSQNFGADLRLDLFTRIQSLSFVSLDKFDRASLVTRLTNDVTQVQAFVNGLMRIFVKAPLLCIGGLIMATRLNPHLAVVLAVVVPVVGVLIIINMSVGFPLFGKVQEALDRVNSLTREYLSGVRVVKAFNQFVFEEAKFNEANQGLQAITTTANRVMAVFSPVIMLSLNIGIVCVLWLGGNGVKSGKMQVGQIIAFTNYMTQILFALMLISMVFNMFVRAKASAGRIGEVFAEENTLLWEKGTVGEMLTKGRVDFEGVSFSYAGLQGEAVLKNISFTGLPGETIGIIGPTGSGKSSLVGLIPRFYDVSSGRIKVDGTDIRSLDSQVLREKIAIVPQKTVLFTGTVEENIRWGKEDATMAEIEDAAKIANAHEFIMASPEGYQTRLGQGGVNFSGGQKQRVSIARALVRKPELLILDDSTSAVDVTTERAIKAALREFAQGLTCILIAQRITSVMDLDKIVVLDHGEIVGMGKHDELIDNCVVYREIFQSQVGREE